MLKQNHRPVVSREVYTRQSIESAWPSGHWVEDTELEEAEAAPGSTGSDSPAPSSSVTVIGGTKYDPGEMGNWLSCIKPGTRIITGDGRGVEKDLAHAAREIYGLEVDVITAEPRKVGVEAVMSADITSPVLLVGGGERVKQAKSWLKRANWGREVEEL